MSNLEGRLAAAGKRLGIKVTTGGWGYDSPSRHIVVYVGEDFTRVSQKTYTWKEIGLLVGILEFIANSIEEADD